jgi:hypothetical protein
MTNRRQFIIILALLSCRDQPEHKDPVEKPTPTSISQETRAAFIGFELDLSLAGVLRSWRPQNNNPNKVDNPAQSSDDPSQNSGEPPIFRTFDGRFNNLTNPDLGKAGTPLSRLTPPDYDGRNLPAGTFASRPSPRVVSNGLMDQPEDQSVLNEKRVSDLLWAWGQFIDHDIDLSPIDEEASLPIQVPEDDPHFTEDTLPFSRSQYIIDSRGRRQQINSVSTYLDASQVYGSDAATAQSLRAPTGKGKLLTSAQNLLPFDPEAPTPSFRAGDIRVNENVALTAIHTLFVREHNRIATEIAERNPQYSTDQVYQLARILVTAEIQAITFREFLPLVLGSQAIPAYTAYDPQCNPRIANEFSTVAYRFGHSMISNELKRLDANGQTISAGSLALADAFANPSAIINEGIAPILRGLATQVAQKVDPLVVNGLRNFLFLPEADSPGTFFDLPALNMQRGRDHGLPDYNRLRRALGLSPREFRISDDSSLNEQYQAIYQSPSEIDPWAGGLAEEHRPDTLVGPLFYTIIKDQFIRLRDSDRFWYERYLTDEWVQWINRQTIATVIRRNTIIANEIPNQAFLAP